MTLPRLNFPQYQFSVRQTDDKTEIFDIVRKKYVALTPEEWVRQHVVHYLHHTLGYPIELICVEGSITINTLPKRCDIIVYTPKMKPALLVECKKPAVALQQKTFDQAMIYNTALEVPYILITNGLQNCCFSYDRNSSTVVYHQGVPIWETLLQSL